MKLQHLSGFNSTLMPEKERGLIHFTILMKLGYRRVPFKYKTGPLKGMNFNFLRFVEV